MPDLLEGVVSRPNSHDPAKGYAAVIGRREEWFADFDHNDAQAILRQDLAALMGSVFREGAVLFEAGGTIGDPIPGPNVGSDALGSAGTYVGIESQLYTVKVTTGGVAGVAQFTWSSTGNDNPPFAGYAVPITAIAPDLATALADLATYGHAVGLMGVRVVFVNPAGFVTAGNTWVVNVVYGAQPPTVAGNDLTTADVLIPVRGRLHRVPGTTLTFPAQATGVSIVYAEWTRTVVTHVDDPTLTDPLSERGTAWREQWSIALRTTDTSTLPPGANERERRVFPIYQWDRATNVVSRVLSKAYELTLDQMQGALDARQLLNVRQNQILLGLLADLDDGAHGSYVVSPLAPSPRAAVSPNPASPGKIKIALPPIKARVAGLAIDRATPAEVEVDQATDTGEVLSESKVYTAGANPFLLNKAAGQPAFPIAQVTRLSAAVQVGTVGVGGYEAVTRSASGDFDNLAKTPVIALVRISNTQGGPADYVLNTDYQLAGDQVQWISANKPAAGNPYYVVYQYTKLMVLNTDFILTGAGAIDFAAVGGDEPVSGSAFLTDYDYYLPRTDAILLRPTGELALVRGLPAEVPVVPPLPQFVLPFARIDIPANSVVGVVCTGFNNDRVDMVELNRMREALFELTRNFVNQDLLNQARARMAGLAGAPASANFVDILADDFSTTDLASLNYNVGGVVFDATIDTEVGELTLPFTQSIHALSRIGAPAGDVDVRVGAAYWTLPYGHELALDAPKWSEEYKVNPYADFRPEPPSGFLVPSQDSWVDTAAGLDSTRTRIVQNGRHIDRSIVGAFTRTRTTTATLPAVFMRQIQVSLFAGHFVPGERVRMKFANQDVQLTAVAPTTQGADAFTVIARQSDATHKYGDVTAQFTVPPNIPTGTVGVVLYGDQGNPAAAWPQDFVPRLELAFSSNGTIRQTSTETVTTLIQNDPVAQSFVFPAPRMISRVDVPFAAKPPNGSAPLLCELRATDRAGTASTPIDTVLASLSREAVDVQVGPNSANLFDMPDPVIAFANEFRALVLRSADNSYRIYRSTLGPGIAGGGGPIATQQIPTGIFMDSSNNVDWTPHQKSDLRCKVWVAKMTALEAVLYLDRVTAANTTGFFLNPDQVIPDGTSITWQYSVDGLAPGTPGKVWTTCVPTTVVELPAVTGTLDLRAILRTTDAYLTPAVHTRNCSVLVQSNKTAGTYVSRQKALSGTTTVVHGGIQLITPSGGSQVVYVSVDDGATWSQATLSGGVPGRDNFTEHTFTKTGLAAGSKLRLRVESTTADRAKRTRARGLYAFAPPA